MIDRKKLPDFMRDMSEERLRELMEEDKQPKRRGFDEAMDRILHKVRRNETKKYL